MHSLSSRMYCKAATVVLLATSILVPSSLVSGETIDDFDFTYSRNPSDIVLRMWIIGGLLPDDMVYTVSGSGSLILRRVAPKYREGSPIVETYEGLEVAYRKVVELSDEDVEELLGLALSNGLLETSSAEIEQRVSSKKWYQPDGATVNLEIEVTSYARSGENLGARKQHLRVYAPATAHRVFPDYAPLEALTEIHQWLSAKVNSARKGSWRKR